ncbi:interferon alpha-inducible protein 27-like protein 2A isoform X2 [Maylandia zebra]|uniref:interferon alpha-inducible protein 27-like protein 2A isoform X2 n=1 Tax=Maylandia zebra TaxID=106582 RepID=UPI00403C7AC2
MILLTVVAIAVGAGVAVVSAPIVLAAVGFTSTGIAASSYAAIWMSATAIANGGGVAAGSLFSLLQSAGMAGLSLLANAVLGIVGGIVGGIVAFLANFI